jgi:hypothetical protein
MSKIVNFERYLRKTDIEINVDLSQEPPAIEVVTRFGESFSLTEDEVQKYTTQARNLYSSGYKFD